jgi:hypothetical protein
MTVGSQRALRSAQGRLSTHGPNNTVKSSSHDVPIDESGVRSSQSTARGPMRFLAVSLALITSTAIAPPTVAPGSGCDDTRYPPELPAPGVLVDSANAIADLAAFARPSKPMVFSLVFSDGDSLPRIRPLDGSDPATATALAKYIRPQPASQLWAIRVQIAGGDAPALTLARSEYCPPLPRSPIVTGTFMSTMARPGQFGPPSMPGAAAFEALIAVTGRVRVARLTQSSGVPHVDSQGLGKIYRQGFHPARLDGEAVEGWWRSAADSPRP